MNRHERRAIHALAEKAHSALTPQEAQKAIHQGRAIVAQKAPILLRRSDQLVGDLGACRDAESALRTIAEGFKEIGDWMTTYPEDAVWLAFAPALVAMGAALGTVEKWYAENEDKRTPEIASLIKGIKAGLAGEDPDESLENVAKEAGIGFQGGGKPS